MLNILHCWVMGFVNFFKECYTLQWQATVLLHISLLLSRHVFKLFSDRTSVAFTLFRANLLAPLLRHDPLESQGTQHVTRSFYCAYEILKYVLALCESSESCSAYSFPGNSFPPKLFLYETVPWICTADWYCQTYKGTTKISGTLCMAPFSPEHCSSNWNHLGLPQLQSYFLSQFSQATRFYLDSPSLHWDLRSENCLQAESWAINGLTSFIFYLSEITVLHYLLFNIWKRMSHVFCPVS